MPWRRTAAAAAAAAEKTPLQFGHGIDAVETEVYGAARTFEYKLQFGHGIDAVETPSLVGEAPYHTFKASIRPRHRCRGDLRGLPRGCHALQCFNSATA